MAHKCFPEARSKHTKSRSLFLQPDAWVSIGQSGCQIVITQYFLFTLWLLFSRCNSLTVHLLQLLTHCKENPWEATPPSRSLLLLIVGQSYNKWKIVFLFTFCSCRDLWQTEFCSPPQCELSVNEIVDQQSLCGVRSLLRLSSQCFFD